MTQDQAPFALALSEILRRRGFSQRWLGDRLGLTRAAVNDWCQGRGIPRPETVFAIEAALGIRAGTLSRTLGYLPVTNRRQVPTVEVIEKDPRLNDKDRETLVFLYERFAKRP